jgi:hypothetical protein
MNIHTKAREKNTIFVSSKKKLTNLGNFETWSFTLFAGFDSLTGSDGFDSEILTGSGG